MKQKSNKTRKFNEKTTVLTFSMIFFVIIGLLFIFKFESSKELSVNTKIDELKRNLKDSRDVINSSIDVSVQVINTLERTLNLNQSTEEINDFITNTLKSLNPNRVYGIGVWLIPGKSKDFHYYGMFNYYSKGEISSIHYASDFMLYNYFEQEWYKKAIDNPTKVMFSGPKDEGDNIYISLSKAILRKGEIIGVIDVEMSLTQINSMIDLLNRDKDEVLYLTTKDGSLVSHPEHSKILFQLKKDDHLHHSIFGIPKSEFEEWRLKNEQLEPDDLYILKEEFEGVDIALVSEFPNYKFTLYNKKVHKFDIMIMALTYILAIFVLLYIFRRLNRIEMQAELIDFYFDGYTESLKNKITFNEVKNSSMSAQKILGYAQEELNPPIKNKILQAIKLSKHTEDIASNSLSELANRKMTIINMSHLITSIEDELRETISHYNIQFELSNTIQDTDVFGNEPVIENAIKTLVMNSVELIKTYNEKWISIKILRRSDSLFISIKDSSISLSLYHTEPLFEKKPSRSLEGLISLEPSKSLLSEFNGNLYYDQASTYSCFVIELPVHQKRLETTIA